MMRSGGPCLFSIDNIKFESCTENGDVMGFVMDTYLKKVIVKSGVTRIVLIISLVDESSPNSPIIYQLWDDLVRKYQRLVVRGAFLFISNFTRLKSREGEIIVRGGELSIFFGANLQGLLESPQYNSLYPVEQQTLTQLIDYIKATHFAPLIRYSQYILPLYYKPIYMFKYLCYVLEDMNQSNHQF